MENNNIEKKAGFFQKLIGAVRSMFGGGNSKAAETTAVSTASAQKLSKVEMLEMLIDLGKENARLKADIEEKNRMIEKQNLFLQASRKMTPVLTMEDGVQLDSAASNNGPDVGSVEMEDRVAEAELKALEAHARLKEADQRAEEAQAKLEEAQARIEEAELKAQKAAAMAREAEQRARTAEEKAAQAEQRFHTAGNAGEAGIRSEDAEEKVEAAKNSETEVMPIELTEKAAVMPVEPTEKAAESLGAFDETIEAEPEAVRGIAGSEELFDSPAPGSFAAMIAARAAEAAIRERMDSRVMAEEKATEEQSVAEERTKAKQTEVERIAEAFEENLNEKPVEEAQNPEPVAKAMKDISDKKEPEKDRLERITGRVPMREAARRAGLVK